MRLPGPPEDERVWLVVEILGLANARLNGRPDTPAALFWILHCFTTCQSFEPHLNDARCRSISSSELPAADFPILHPVKVVPLRDLHLAQTLRFPFVADKPAASALRQPL